MKKLFTILLLAVSTVVSATKYYVSNTGNDALAGTSTATAWKTIAKVNSTVFVGGDEISFKKGGVWREKFIPRSSGSSSSPIRFSSYDSGNNPIISGAFVMTGFINGGGNIWDKTGVTVQANVLLANRVLGELVTSRGAISKSGDWYWSGGTLSVYSVSDPSGLIEAGQLDRVLDTYTFSCNNLSFTGITFECGNSSGSTMAYIRAANLTGIKFYSSTFQYSAGHGVYFYGSTSSTDNVLDGCIIRENWRDGIFIQQKGDYTINNCKIYSNGLKPTTEHNGIFGWLGGTKIKNCDIYDNGRWDILAHGIYAMANEEAVIIDNCIIHDQPNGSSIRLRGSADITNCKLYGNVQAGIGIAGNEANNVTYNISSNLIYDNINYGLIQGSAKGTGSVSINVNNNTFYNNGADATIMIVPVIENLSLKNNVFFSTQSGGIVVSIADSKTTIHSNNAYYRSITGDPVYIKKDGVNLAKSGVLAWEPTAIIVDPLFNSTSDFHLKLGSPAIGKGIVISGVVKDISGVAYKIPPDIGCYQSAYTATPPPPPPAPVYLTSSISESSPDAIAITYNLSLATVVPEVNAFNIKVNRVERAVKSVGIVDGEVKLTMDRPVVKGDTTILSYVKPSVNPLQSVSGGVAESIFSKSVTNSVITAAPDTVPEPEVVAEVPIVPVSTEPLPPGIKITVYPNPVHHILNILCEYTSTYSEQEAIIARNSIRIFDLSGKLMLEKRLDPGVTSQQFPINLKSGVFVVLLISKGQTLSSQKFIVYN